MVDEDFFFRGFIIFVIVIAGICVGLETDSSLSPALKAALSSLNQYVFKSIFLLELVIKIVAEGLKPWRFFSDNWNNFDFVVVIVLLIPFQRGSALFVLRLLRVLRVLKIMTALPVRWWHCSLWIMLVSRFYKSWEPFLVNGFWIPVCIVSLFRIDCLNMLDGV